MTVGRYFNGLNLDALWLNNCEKIIIKQNEDDKEILIIKLGNDESKIYLPKEIASKQMAYSERIDKILYIYLRRKYHVIDSTGLVGN